MSSIARSYRAVGRPAGAVVIGLGVAIAICAIAGVILDVVAPWPASKPQGGVIALGVSAGVTVALGIGLVYWGRAYPTDTITRRQAILSVSLIWVLAGICGGLPFVLHAGVTPDAAFFEAVSGLTTTGATIFGNIEGTLSRPVLLWRSLIQWLGGMGIVVLFVAVFPNVGAGGKHMFRGEVPGTTAEGLKPRIAETSFTLWKLYALFTVIEAVLLAALGMEPFEAVCHALTTMATGGFSTRDSSIGAFESPAIHYVISAFMLIASVNFGLYYAVLKTRSFKALLHSIELRAFLVIVGVATVALTIATLRLHDYDVLEAFRYGLFQTATFVSTTGYVTDDYMAYPGTGIAVLLLLQIFGGCSGSTAGGLKVERVVLLWKQMGAQIQRAYRPSVVSVIRMGRTVFDATLLSDVGAMFVLLMITIAAGTVLLPLTDGVSVGTAFGATLTCVGNSGPAVFYSGADNFVSYSPVARIFLSLAMLLGRLEFFTLLALFVPGFWKR